MSRELIAIQTKNPRFHGFIVPFMLIGILADILFVTFEIQ